MMLEHASYLLSETLLADGLGNIAVEAHVKTALLIPLHGVCGHGDGGLSRFCRERSSSRSRRMAVSPSISGI